MDNKVTALVCWARDLGNVYNISTLTILSQFYRLKTAGADVEEAKREIEEVYELGGIA